MKSYVSNAPMKSLTQHEGASVPRRHQKVATFFRRLTEPQRRSLAALWPIGDDPAAATALSRRLINWIGAQP